MCVKSPSWHPSHGGPAATGDGGCLQRCEGSPDGCLRLRYLCCRAGVHCQSALITGTPRPRTTSSLRLISTGANVTHSGASEKEKPVLRRAPINRSCFRLIQGELAQKFGHQQLEKTVQIQCEKLYSHTHTQDSDITLTANRVIIRVRPRK